MSSSAEVVDWRPGRAEATIWNVVAIVLIAAGLPLFALPSILRSGPAGASFRIGLTEILLVVALIALLLLVHEGIHGLVMLAFHARPSFGVVLVGGAMPALLRNFSRPSLQPRPILDSGRHAGGCHLGGRVLVVL